jgi:CubicO group peptidase (beta-lactamase class C family)
MALQTSSALVVDRLARIDSTLTDFITQGVIAGADVLVAQHGKVVHRATLGLKDIARGEPLGEDTIYRIYSMTKPVTAVAMMMLHEQKLWSVEAPIATYLPEFADVKGPGGSRPDHPPTMRELMTHTAGFGYGIGLGPFDETDSAYIAAGIWQSDNLAMFARRIAGIPLAYQPGSAWRYSLSMDLQGAIIERLSGQSLPDFMRSRIFAPLGMTDTGFFLPPDKLDRLATLYHMYGTTALTVLDHPSFARDPLRQPLIPSGGGGLYSTMADYSRFAQMLLGRGQVDGIRLLNAASVDLMTANHLPEEIIRRGVIAGFQKICPGRGYAFNGAVFHDPAAAGSRVGRGTYQWDGASGVWFWIDPENDLLFVGMIQRMMQDGMPRLQELTQALIADALAPAPSPGASRP